MSDNLAALLAEAAARHPSRPALFHERVRIDYAELEQARRASPAFSARKVSVWETASACSSPTGQRSSPRYYATLRLGADRRAAESAAAVRRRCGSASSTRAPACWFRGGQPASGDDGLGAAATWVDAGGRRDGRRRSRTSADRDGSRHRRHPLHVRAQPARRRAQSSPTRDCGRRRSSSPGHSCG